MGDDDGQRSLRKDLQEWGERRRDLAHNTETPLPHRRHLGQHFSKTPPPHRSLQEGDYFDLYGGDINVIYDGPNIRANWDGSFFWMGYGAEGETQYEPIYGKPLIFVSGFMSTLNASNAFQRLSCHTYTQSLTKAVPN